MSPITLSKYFDIESPIARISTIDAERSIHDLSGNQLIIDHFSYADCLFIRSKSGKPIELIFDSLYNFHLTESGGYLGISQKSDHPTLWIPHLSIKRQANKNEQILSEQSAVLSGFSWNIEGASCTIQSDPNSCIDFIVWRFKKDHFTSEILSNFPIEACSYFLWGSHGCIKKPADLYRHLIQGKVYDLRYSWPHNKKCFSENEAHALYSIFSGLEKHTGKSLYRYFQSQLVLSLIQRQSDDGGWYHGMWTDSSECHYRLHTSGVHLLMDEYQRTGCPHVKQALQKAASFLSKNTDQLSCGTWFLHDSLELSEKAMNSGPFRWIANTTLGKSPSNMLVLNTHLDTMIALNRYGRITGDHQFQHLVNSALNSTRAVLGLKTADWLYKSLFWAIGLTMLPTEKASQLPLPIRAIKRFAWQYLIKKLPDIKARFPRLVMPNGYIDRELSLRTWAIDYQTINLMDLARYAYSFPNAFDESVLDKAMEFTQNSGLIKRYRELSPDKRYSVGFWSEALYYRCLTKPDIKYRQWLAEAILECHDLKFGLSPSLLGTNGEAAHYNQHFKIPLSLINNSEILIANLSVGPILELLIVNSTEHALIPTWLPEFGSDWIWKDINGKEILNDHLILNSRDWVIGNCLLS